MTDETTFLQDLATRWSLIFDAQKTQGDISDQARNSLLVRYHRAVYRYLNKLLGDENAAAEVCSDFALRLKEKAPFIKQADRSKGKFRNYLMAVLWQMVQDYHRRRQRQKKKEEPYTDDTDNEPEVYDDLPPSEKDAFVECWRRELTEQVWSGLETVEREKGTPYATLFRLLPPDETAPVPRSEELARLLTERTGKPHSRDAVRKMLQRGRELFAELLVQEVKRSLEDRKGEQCTTADVEEELIELGLLNSYCKKALAEVDA